MTITTPAARAQLGAPTLNRKYWLDVREPGSTAWLGVHGIQELKNKPSVATTQDSSDFDGRGYKSSAVTALEHGVELKVVRKPQADTPTAYDPGQELLRAAAKRMGSGNRVEFRIYEMEPGGPRVEAEQGFASVTWDPDGGGMDALDTVAVNLNGQGERVDIAHPGADDADADGETDAP